MAENAKCPCIYGLIRIPVNLLLEGSYLNLKDKQALSLVEQKLLGQLSVLPFRGSKVKDVVECLNFCRALPIKLAYLPTWCNHGKDS